jgi:hypothetical protein
MDDSKAERVPNADAKKHLKENTCKAPALVIPKFLN